MKARRTAVIPETIEPWNKETYADLAQRKASKFFLLVSEASCRQMAELGTVPHGVQAQCAHLLTFMPDGEAG